MGKEIYNVLWFEDNPKVSFIDNAFISGITVNVAENLEKGIALLNSIHSWDAFIFDANYKKKEGSESALVLSDLINEVVKRSNDKTPWFVLTAGDFAGIEAISYIIPESIWEKELGTKRFYNKVGEDEETLFDDIKRTVKYQNTIEWNIKNNYNSVFDACKEKYLGSNTESYLLQIIKKTQSDDLEDLIKSFNALRDVIELLFKKLNNLQIIPNVVFEGKGWINGCSKFLASKHEKVEWVVNPIHPTVSFQLFTLLQIVQDASHEVTDNLNLKVKDFIGTNRTTYLYKSAVFLLLDIIVWFKNFIDENTDIEKNKSLWKETIRPTVFEDSNNTVSHVSESDKIIGIIEQDDKGNFHCNEYLLKYTYVSNNYQVGDEIEITEFQDNGNSRTSFYYSKYATKFKKI